MADRPTAQRALILNHSAGLGGAELGMVDLVSFAPSEFLVVLLEHGPLEERLHAVGAHVRVLPLPPITGKLIGPSGWRRAHQVLRAALGLRRKVESAAVDGGCDVVVLNSLRALLLMGICGRPRGLRCVAFVQDGLARPYLPLLQMAASRLALWRTADLALANSGWTASFLPRSVPTEVLPSLSGRQFFETTVSASVRATSRDGDGMVRVLLLARMVEWKGQLRVLQRIDEVRASRSWSLTLAGGAWFGEEAYLERVRRLAATIEEPTVYVIGHVYDVVDLIDEHDVVLHASTVPEPFGQVVVQAIARGKAVIVADAGGAADFVSTGACLGFDPARPEQIAEKLRRLIDDDGERERLGGLALRASEKFDPRLIQAELRDRIFDRVSRSASEESAGAVAADGDRAPKGPSDLSVAVILASAGRPSLLADALRDCSNQESVSFTGVVSVPDEDSLPEQRGLLDGWRVVVGTRGLAAQRNAGMEVLGADVDVVVFFDDDAVPRVDYLAQALAFFRAHPGTVGLTGRVLLDGKISGEIDRSTALATVAESSRAGLTNSWRSTTQLYGANFAFRRQAAADLRFDEQLPLYSWLEDYDFARRLGRRGPLGHVDDCVIVHRAAASGGRTSHLRLGYSQVMNPIHLVRQGSFTVWLALREIGRPVAKNLALAGFGPASSWRRERLRGNVLAARDAIEGRVTPQRIVDLRSSDDRAHVVAPVTAHRRVSEGDKA